MITVAIALLIVRWSMKVDDELTASQADANRKDPYHIGLFALTDEDRAWVGADVDPDTITMQVYFESKPLPKGSSVRSAQVRVNALFAGIWDVHANGRLTSTLARNSDPVALTLDEAFYADARSYLAYPAEKRSSIGGAPRVWNEDVLYRLVWYRNTWYLVGADEAYRTAVVALRATMVADRVNLLTME
jgi:hypothetical protein